VSALPQAGYERRPMTVCDLDAVVAIESAAYGFPWTRGNFIDTLAAGYLAEVLEGRDDGVVGYFVAMAGVDELHLLNVTVVPARQGQGHGHALLDAVAEHGRRLGMATLWLEVRESNRRARALYRRRGFAEEGVRRNYYPAAAGRREDAVVMSLALGARGTGAVV
jgi:ribosomal-protein-alanine N-acetyltransferase